MRVGIKKILAGAAGFVGMMALADVAAAGCNTGCQPPQPPPPPVTPCCLPPPPPVRPPVIPPVPPVTPRDGVNGWGGGGNVNVNVNVNVAGARAFGGARAGGTVIVGGGGGAYFNVDQPYPTTIQGLSVEGKSMEMVRVPYTASRRMEKRVVIQAVCIDDRAVPHPASQVRPGKDVATDYEGELYRCIAGTKLQWTIADEAGGPGETINCNKREALWYGRGGQLECRPEKQERDCNERSLLRRYGAGVKVLTMIREETYTEYREEMVESAGAVASGAVIMLDGGVGGRVF
ncbi:hypothetical protein [Brevundimonas sp. P7753]|uniref:hypothetical protein n=1 Tax=Brevundimonas TaxID=41275 RepID=UPI0015BE0008|nr:hypothetical protein [Brevundimonas sp. P7753]MBD3832616.1 hypothetical protein [Brevundimonas sp.]NWE53492.1 hypothetical protein [Brevundimonas sp. P7753]